MWKPVERGDLYRSEAPRDDPRRTRIYVVMSRPEFLLSRYTTAICVPIYSAIAGLATEVVFDERNGLKHPSAARCDEITRIRRDRLTEFLGRAKPEQLLQLSQAVALACSISPEDLVDGSSR
jgi:mRNA interferase MazF